MKRRIMTLLIAGLLLLTTACGNAAGQTQDPAPTPEPAEPETPPATQTPEPETTPTTSPETTEPPEAEGGNVLVLYYSATGSTETVAGYIASALGGDTFAITPAEPYTSDDLNWTNEDSRVSQEHDDPSLRTMELETTTVENWDSYDTVFIGYPIWWGIAAWPVDNFVSANDFTGKTVIPFCTSSSSGLGQSGELLAELAGTGDWQEGQRFRSGASEADVTEWVSGLNIQ